MNSNWQQRTLESQFPKEAGPSGMRRQISSFFLFLLAHFAHLSSFDGCCCDFVSYKFLLFSFFFFKLNCLCDFNYA